MTDRPANHPVLGWMARLLVRAEARGLPRLVKVRYGIEPRLVFTDLADGKRYEVIIREVAPDVG